MLRHMLTDRDPTYAGMIRQTLFFLFRYCRGNSFPNGVESYCNAGGDSQYPVCGSCLLPYDSGFL